MNNNSNSLGASKRLKIFKTATQVSIMDVTSALDYHIEKDSEMSYRGSIAFLINEYGRSKITLQSFIPKSKCKMLFSSIIDGSFASIFPIDRGFEEYGGSAKKRIARTIRVTFELNQHDFSKSRYVFQIDEGEGTVGRNGQISMKKRERSVRTYVNIYQAIEMAHEIIDYIKHEELISLMNDKPLYTWITYQNNQSDDQHNVPYQQHSQQQQYQQQDQSQHMQQHYPNNVPNHQQYQQSNASNNQQFQYNNNQMG